MQPTRLAQLMPSVRFQKACAIILEENSMTRRSWLVAALGICSVAASPVIDLQRVSRVKLQASGESQNFEWFFLPISVAKAQGLWTRHGLDMDFVPAAASAAQLKQQVESGIKIGLVNTAEVLLARAAGTPVKVVAGYLGETVAKVFVRAGSPMKAARDLDGKKVGIISETHTSYRAVLYINQKLRIKAEPVVLGNLGSNAAALKAGTVDAIYSAEGAALTMVDSGVLKVLVALSDVYPKPYTAAVVWATDDLIDQKPDVVKAFVQTVLEAAGYLKEHRNQGVDLYIERTNAPRSLADRSVAELNRFLMPSGRGSGQDLIAAVASNWQFTKDSGAVPPGAELDIGQAVDPRFLP